MKVQVVKYMCALSQDTEMTCSQKLPGCEEKASIHVCFEAGKGTFVCRHCFDRQINEGHWTTDSTEVLLAS